MVNIGEYIAPLVSGVVVALSSWLPTSPEGYSIMGFLEGVTPAYVDYLVPAYLGVTFAVLFYFKEKIALGSQRALRRSLDSDVKYLLYATLFTLLIGYPLLVGLRVVIDPKVSDFINALLGFAIFLFALFMGRFRPLLGGTKEKISEEKDGATLLDSIVSGLLQGGTLMGGFSRSGFVFFGLVVTGVTAKKALELSFLIAPVYFILKLAFVGGWDPELPVPLLFAAFLSAFVTSIVTMKGLLKAVEVFGERGFIAVFGLIPVFVYLVGVIL
ncbi:undecaprenyl-diphosphate phosphatase [Thermococcus thermotolerans]|uniref:undecaprenyl-diphosphate phosphatase n=1 Tax=Thermococcus thermotolerans TaxID=2969672 RepID=UPI002157CE54|nr:undecaprenyl-diphosphate phosphatase [Thermococcus thermotolerans]